MKIRCKMLECHRVYKRYEAANASWYKQKNTRVKINLVLGILTVSDSFFYTSQRSECLCSLVDFAGRFKNKAKPLDMLKFW